MNSGKVVCIGEALIDRIINISKTESIDYLGGAPANVACALRKLNIQTSFIGNLGDDSYGKSFWQLFQRLEIDTSLLQIDKKYNTRIVEVLRDRDGDRSFSGFVKSKDDLFSDQLLAKALIVDNISNLKKLYSDSKFIVAGTILLASPKSAESINFLLNYAMNFDIKIVIDLNWRKVFWDNTKNINLTERVNPIQTINSFLSFADILKLSKEEADMFFPNKSAKEISYILPKTPDVLITNGGDSIQWFICKFEGISELDYTGKIIDTTGAGDAFLAGFISQMYQLKEPITKANIQKSIRFASACGFLTCLGEGAIEPQPIYERVQGFIKF
tara:strand:- start:6342 stop:7331 length:990 start_codon:yes stop_codon:yes gene_type:complete